MRTLLLVPMMAVLLEACGGRAPLQAITPQVLETYPAAGSFNVPVTTTLWARFDAAVDQVWLAGHFMLTDGTNGPITVSITYDVDTHTASFTPSAPLVHGTA